MDITQITKAQIVSVYSGKDGKCCCGCAGKHVYNSAFAAEMSKKRGYEVDVSKGDREIDRVLKLVASQPKVDFVESCLGSHFSAVVGKRVYIVYLNDAKSEVKS